MRFTPSIFGKLLEPIQRRQFDTLVKRFSETRRRHPFSSDERTLTEAIEYERELLLEARELGVTFDTSDLPAACCERSHSGSTSIHGSGTRPCTRRCISTSASCMSTAAASSGCVVLRSLSSATSRESARCGRGGRSGTD